MLMQKLRLVQRNSYRREDVKFQSVCGKKRKKRQTVKGGSQNNQTPRRITQETIQNLGSLKAAIKQANMQQQEQTENIAVNRAFPQKYRKKKKTPAELAAEKERIRLKEGEPAPGHLKNIYGENLDENPHIVVVDGYNVLAEMVKQDERRFKGKDLSEQRDLMQQDISIFGHLRAIRVCIVYDACGNPNKDSRFARQTESGMDIVFCLYYEADKGLAVEADRYIAEGSFHVTVITSDNAARDACVRPPRIDGRSSKIFVEEVQQCVKEMDATIEETNMRQERVQAWSMTEEDKAELAALRELLQDQDLRDH